LPVGYGHKYIESRIRHDLEVTDLQVTLELPKFSKLNQFVVVRRRNFEHLFSRLESVQGRILPHAKQNSELSWFGSPIKLGPDSGVDPEELADTALVMRTSLRLLVHPGLTIPMLGYTRGSIIEFAQG
jgi:dTDP-4-amino-4,6-dideoxygalactose transaminase